MKILYTANEDMRKQGAGKTHFFEVARNLIKLEHELLIVLPGYKPQDMADYGLNIKYVPTFRKNVLSYLFYEALNIFYLVYYIFCFKPNVIYSRSGLFDFMVPIMAKIFSIPYIGEKNGIFEDEFRNRNISEFYIALLKVAERINLQFATKIVCVTGGIKTELARRYGQSEEKFVVIPNGANTELFRPLLKLACREKIGLNKDDFIVGFVGSFAPWQGLELLLASARELDKNGYHSIKFALVGDGEQMPLLRQLVAAYGLENTVVFLGTVRYDEVATYIGAFDVCYMCKQGLEFGFSPLKLYEYLACSRPVIASEVAGLVEVIAEANSGYLFTPGDKNSLSVAITSAFINRVDHEAMGSRGRQLVEQRFSWQATSMLVSTLLEEVRGSSGKKD